MELTKIYRKIGKFIHDLVETEEELGKMKCDSETELKTKKLILEYLGYGTNSLIIMVDLMNEAFENEDITLAMETFREQYADELVH